MAWRDAHGEQIVASRSPAESGVLAPEVWHLWVGQGAPERPDAVGGALADTAHADLVIARYASGHAWVGAVLGASGRMVIPAGNIMYWECTRPIEPAVPPGPDAGLHMLEADDAVRCAAMVAEVFAGYTNHYSANPRLRSVSVADAYADWAARSLDQPGCEVVEWRGPDGAAQGLAVTRRVDDTVEILLAGTHPRCRGKGAYAAMLAAVVGRALAADASRVVISTQDHNVPVQRIWGRCGLAPVLGVTVVHLITDGVA